MSLQFTLGETAEQLPPGLKQCPECGKVVPDSNSCLYCGHWLGPSWVLEVEEAHL